MILSTSSKVDFAEPPVVPRFHGGQQRAACVQHLRGSGRPAVRDLIVEKLAPPRLHNLKRLLVRYERRADIHRALLGLACCLVCFRRLRNLAVG
jgi:hypothetical protein